MEIRAKTLAARVELADGALEVNLLGAAEVAAALEARATFLNESKDKRK